MAKLNIRAKECMPIDAVTDVGAVTDTGFLCVKGDGIIIFTRDIRMRQESKVLD